MGWESEARRAVSAGEPVTFNQASEPMRLEIKTYGNLEQVVISKLSKAFVARIFRHCWGKNNTPYFANNCFKGILYFDERLAAKYAEDVETTYTNWFVEDKYYHRTAMVYESGLEFSASLDGGEPVTLNPAGMRIDRKVIDRAPSLAQVGEEEVAILMGSVDKGGLVFTLDGVTGDFDPDKLTLSLEGLEEFFFEDALMVGLSYDGKTMGMEVGESRGKSMIAPILISREGRELDMYDFS